MRLRGLIAGLIGFGRIATNIAHKLAIFGVSVVAYDPYVSESYMRSFGARKIDFETLLSNSVLVIVMCPHTPETHHLIDAAALARMGRRGLSELRAGQDRGQPRAVRGAFN